MKQSFQIIFAVLKILKVAW